MHANGDAAIDRTLDAFERAHDFGLDPGRRRPRIEHRTILHDEQIGRTAEFGISPRFPMGRVHFRGRAFVDDTFGPEKAAEPARPT